MKFSSLDLGHDWIVVIDHFIDSIFKLIVYLKSNSFSHSEMIMSELETIKLEIV